MQNLRELLWYTIPGALAIIPLICLDIFPIQNLSAGASVGFIIFISLPTGFVLNQIWSLWWNDKGEGNGLANKNRQALQFILEQLKLEKEDKKFKLAYLIWGYWAYEKNENKGIKELFDKSRNYWTHYHSCRTCIIASIIASIIALAFLIVGLVTVLKFHSSFCIQKPVWLLIIYVILISFLWTLKRQLWNIINEWELMIAESNIRDILKQNIIDAARKTLKFKEKGEHQKENR